MYQGVFYRCFNVSVIYEKQGTLVRMPVYIMTTGRVSHCLVLSVPTGRVSHCLGLTGPTGPVSHCLVAHGNANTPH